MSNPGPGARSTPVSIVVPTHHRPALLARLLESLSRQTYPHALLEIILVANEDDAEAFAVAKRFEQASDIPIRCVAIANDPSGGRSAAAKRNYGVVISRAAWIAFIDDDCVASPDWISAASAHFGIAKVAGIEGGKRIPPVEPPTLTYKGLLMLTRPGGYQTCNMFYRRDVFMKIGGFDLSFPFYLEDSDLAWAVLDLGYEILYESRALVEHPVLEPAPWRMLHDARRASLMPYLFKKHPQRYRENEVRTLRPSHWLYLVLYASSIALALSGHRVLAGVYAGLVFGVLVLHTFKLFRGCRVRLHEFVVTASLLPVVPLVKWIQLVRGNLRHRVWLWT